MKKTPLGIYLRNTCAKFQLRRPIIPLSTLPQSSRTDRHTYRHTFWDSSSTEVENRHTFWDSSSTEVENNLLYKFGNMLISFIFPSTNMMFECVINTTVTQPLLLLQKIVFDLKTLIGTGLKTLLCFSFRDSICLVEKLLCKWKGFCVAHDSILHRLKAFLTLVRKSVLRFEDRKHVVNSLNVMCSKFGIRATNIFYMSGKFLYQMAKSHLHYFPIRDPRIPRMVNSHLRTRRGFGY